MEKQDLNRRFFDSPDELLSAVEGAVVETEVVLDIGCGIVPMTYFRPKLHIMMEPWQEYSDILSYRYNEDKSIIILRQKALEGLKEFADKSVDSIFMLDVIEHMPKEIGKSVLEECERVSRHQIIVFTTLGFMPQHVDLNQEKDGWGLNGAEVQEHLSGWLPEDFSTGYNFYICEQFHTLDFKGEQLPQAYGAFYAVKSLQKTNIERPKQFSDFRRPLPIEIKYQELQNNYQQLKYNYQQLENKHQWLLASRTVKISNKIKSLLGKQVAE